MTVPGIIVYISLAELLMQPNELHSMNVEVLEVSENLLVAPLPKIKDQVVIEKAKFLHIYVFPKWLFCSFVTPSQLHLLFIVNCSFTVSDLYANAV
jgi:hypothetical protein